MRNSSPFGGYIAPFRTVWIVIAVSIGLNVAGFAFLAWLAFLATFKIGPIDAADPPKLQGRVSESCVYRRSTDYAGHVKQECP